MSGFRKRREPIALKVLRQHQGQYLRKGQLPAGIGDAVLASLIAQGLVVTGPADSYPAEIGYRITLKGLAELASSARETPVQKAAENPRNGLHGPARPGRGGAGKAAARRRG